jgi:hypothetical protein
MRQKNKQSTLKRRSQHLIEAKAPKKKKRFQNPEITTRQTILTLPAEILLLIINHLPLPWKLSLAWTCKSFAELAHRSTLPRLDYYERTEFLLVFQNDVSNVFFCHCCHQLLPFDPNHWESHTHEANIQSLPHLRFMPFQLFWLPHECSTQHAHLPEQFYHFMFNTKFSFLEANLVMRRHFHGFSHGIPLQTLERHESFENIVKFGKKCVNPLFLHFSEERTCFCLPKQREIRSKTKNEIPSFGGRLATLQQKKNSWRFFFRTIPKIIDDKLYVARFFTINGPLVTKGRLKKLMGSMSIPICYHLTCTAYPSCCYGKYSSPERYLCNCPSIEIRWPFYRQETLTRLDPEQDTCRICSTDYRISIDRGISDSETNINISIYHCLGSCQSPEDELWASFATRDPDIQILSFPHAPKIEPGSIRQKWHEAA